MRRVTVGGLVLFVLAAVCPAPGAEPRPGPLEGRWYKLDEKGADGQYRVEIKGNKFELRDDLNQALYTFTLNSKRAPKEINLVWVAGRGIPRGNRLGAWELKGDRLRLCLAFPGRPRPTAFSRDQGELALYVKQK